MILLISTSNLLNIKTGAKSIRYFSKRFLLVMWLSFNFCALYFMYNPINFACRLVLLHAHIIDPARDRLIRLRDVIIFLTARPLHVHASHVLQIIIHVHLDVYFWFRIYLAFMEVYQCVVNFFSDLKSAFSQLHKGSPHRHLTRKKYAFCDFEQD